MKRRQPSWAMRHTGFFWPGCAVCSRVEEHFIAACAHVERETRHGEFLDCCTWQQPTCLINYTPDCLILHSSVQKPYLKKCGTWSEKKNRVIFRSPLVSVSFLCLRSKIKVGSQLQLQTHLAKHRQLFGEVHHSGDGRGDDFCKLTEGFDVHLAALRCVDDRPLTYVFSLKRQEVGGARCLATAWLPANALFPLGHFTTSDTF